MSTSSVKGDDEEIQNGCLNDDDRDRREAQKSVVQNFFVAEQSQIIRLVSSASHVVVVLWLMLLFRSFAF